MRQPRAQADPIQQMPGPTFIASAVDEGHAQQHVLQRGKAGQEIERVLDEYTNDLEIRVLNEAMDDERGQLLLKKTVLHSNKELLVFCQNQ